MSCDMHEQKFFMDIECPNCGSLCGNGGSGDLFYCAECGWHGELDMDSQDKKLIEDIIAKLRGEVRDGDKIDKCKLKEQLAQVILERDTALNDLYSLAWKSSDRCKYCKFGGSGCDWCVHDPDGELNFVWRGMQEDTK